MQDQSHYQQLQPEDRMTIASMKQQRMQCAGHGPHTASRTFDHWARAGTQYIRGRGLRLAPRPAIL